MIDQIMTDQLQSTETTPKMRRMTVLKGNTNIYNDNRASYLRLTGRWLYNAGFTPGDRIVIEIEPGKLVIYVESNRYA